MRVGCDLKSDSKDERKEEKQSQYLKQQCLVERGESRLGFEFWLFPSLLGTLAKLLQLSEPVYPSGRTLYGLNKRTLKHKASHKVSHQ